MSRISAFDRQLNSSSTEKKQELTLHPLADIMVAFSQPMRDCTVEEILVLAGGLRHPESLIAEQIRQARAANEKCDASILEPYLPPVGEWPVTWAPEDKSVPVLMGAALHCYSGAPPQKIYIALVPTDDWTTIPAHFLWGGWEGCPYPEYHVAALRSWRDRFGAELVAMSYDTMDVRVKCLPRSREEGLNLAREHYIYCPQTVGEGIGTLSNSAENLMESTWWNFWWGG